MHDKEQIILPRIDLIIKEKRPDVIVLTGDYTDDWSASDATSIENMEYLADWVEHKRDDGYQVEVLWGNHDFQYLTGYACSGTRPHLRQRLLPIYDRLNPKIAYAGNGILFTHAGVDTEWAQEGGMDAPMSPDALASALNRYLDNGSYDYLEQCGPARGGWQLPGPLWADIRELKHHSFPQVPQVIGHTPCATVTYHRESDKIRNAPHLPASHALVQIDTMSVRHNDMPIGNGTIAYSPSKRRVDTLQPDRLCARYGLPRWKEAVLSYCILGQKPYHCDIV